MKKIPLPILVCHSVLTTCPILQKFYISHDSAPNIKEQYTKYHVELEKWAESLTVKTTPKGLSYVTIEKYTFVFNSSNECFIALNNSSYDLTVTPLTLTSKDSIQEKYDEKKLNSIVYLPLVQDSKSFFNDDCDAYIFSALFINKPTPYHYIDSQVYLNILSDDDNNVPSYLQSNFSIKENNSIPETLESNFESIIHSSINEEISDPIIDPDDLESNLIFENGDQYEMNKVISLLYKAYTTEQDPELSFYVYYAFEGDPCHISEEDSDEIPDSIKDKINLIIEYFSPEGSSWEYNDGAYNRQSGYSNSPITYYYELSPSINFHEKLNSQEQIKAWFEDKNLLPGVNLDDYFSFNEET